MFENIKKDLGTYETIIEKLRKGETLTNCEDDFFTYFNMYLSKSIMKDLNCSEIVAKIILAYKNMLGDIKLKIE